MNKWTLFINTNNKHSQCVHGATKVLISNINKTINVSYQMTFDLCCSVLLLSLWVKVHHLHLLNWTIFQAHEDPLSLVRRGLWVLLRGKKHTQPSGWLVVRSLARAAHGQVRLQDEIKRTLNLDHLCFNWGHKICVMKYKRETVVEVASSPSVTGSAVSHDWSGHAHTHR